MSKIEQGNNIGDLLFYEQDRNFCRETITVTKDDAIKMGTILAQKTADSSWHKVDPTKTGDSKDGTEVAKAVALADAETRGTKTEVVALVRNGIVKKDALIYPANTTDANKKIVNASLESAGILIREAI